MPHSHVVESTPGTIASRNAYALSENYLRDLRAFLCSCEPALDMSVTNGDDSFQRWCRDIRGGLETLLLQQTHVLLSVQIPLAEVPGFRSLLAAVFGEGFFLHYREIQDCRGQVVGDYPPGLRCVHGHIGAEMLRSRLPAGRLITWVREPVERVVAHYDFWRRSPDWENGLCRELHERNWSLVEFAAQEAVRNETARFFGALSPSDFAFVGLLEAIPESLDLFVHRLEVTAVPIFVDFRAKVSRVETPPAVTAAERAEIARLNVRDLRLYEECRLWFAQARQEAGLA